MHMIYIHFNQESKHKDTVKKFIVSNIIKVAHPKPHNHSNSTYRVDASNMMQEHYYDGGYHIDKFDNDGNPWDNEIDWDDDLDLENDAWENDAWHDARDARNARNKDPWADQGYDTDDVDWQQEFEDAKHDWQAENDARQDAEEDAEAEAG